jgi:hypothetical protein
VELTLTPGSIPAAGGTKSTATATVKDSNGVGVPNASVHFGANAGSHLTFSATDVTADLQGVAKADINPDATHTAETDTITASSGGHFDSKNLVVFGTATTVTLDPLDPATIFAGGDGPKARATVTDAGGRGVPGHTVEFSTDGGALMCGADATPYNGTNPTGTGTPDTTDSSVFTCNIVSKIPDTEAIKARDTNVNKLSSPQTLTVQAGVVTLSLSKSSIKADGADTSNATAVVKDTDDHALKNAKVIFSTNGDATMCGTNNHSSEGTNNNDGSYTCTIKAGTTLGQQTISATAGGAPDTKVLTQHGDPATISLVLNPSSIRAGGTTHSTAIATVKDSGGNPVGGLDGSVSFATDGNGQNGKSNATLCGSATDNNDGTYSCDITPGATAGTQQMIASAGGHTDSKTLTQFGPPDHLTLSLSKNPIKADGADTSTATATVFDAGNRKVTDETVTITTDGDATLDPVTNVGDGTYTSKVTASTTPDTETLTAKTSNDKSATTTLTETQPARGFHPLAPVRILDTRSNIGTTGGKLQPNSSRKIQIAGTGGQGGVPATHVSAVVLNLTGTQGDSQTFLTVYPSGNLPTASNINLPAGRDAANLVTVALAGDGSVQLYNAQGTIHAIFDVVGYYDDGTVAGAPHFNALAPSRILDTRSNIGTTGGALQANTSRAIQVTGKGNVPASHVSSVVLNVTGTRGSLPTYLTVFPQGNPPTASNLNLLPGEDRPNLVVVPVASDGTVKIYNAQGTIDAIFDVTGYYDDGTVGGQGFTPHAPVRILDTRSNVGTTGGALVGGTPRKVQIANVTPVPASGVTAVVINVTGTQASAGTFFTVYPQNPKPTASNLNVPPGTDIANLVVATLAPDGSVQLYSDQGTAHAIFDVVGWFGT